MKPTFWQLRNRIKYIELLRSGTLKQDHGRWRGECGVCAVGAATVLCALGQNQSEKYWNYCLSAFIEPNNPLYESKENYYNERQILSYHYGWNYKEIKMISDIYEDRKLTHKQIADWVEVKHINPYLYMIEKHYTIIKDKCKKELVNV